MKKELNGTKYLSSQIVEVEGEKVFVASDETLDRQGEIIKVDGWNLENYKKNPIILWGHDASHPAIGKAEKFGFKTVDGKKRLVFTPSFHRKDEKSRLISDLVEEGYINEVSVGFIPREYDKNIITKAELLEISFVNNAANPSAGRLSYEFALAKGYTPETIKEVITEEEVEEEKDEEKEELKSTVAEMQKQIDDLELKIKSFEEAKPKSDAGREPVRASKKEIDRRIALKALNRVMESLNKLEK